MESRPYLKTAWPAIDRNHTLAGGVIANDGTEG
jgi:hypothetical protein